jgi:hypothetical protein
VKEFNFVVRFVRWRRDQHSTSELDIVTPRPKTSYRPKNCRRVNGCTPACRDLRRGCDTEGEMNLCQLHGLETPLGWGSCDINSISYALLKQHLVQLHALHPPRVARYMATAAKLE